MVKKLTPFGIVTLFAVIAGIPLLHPGLHPTHDGEYHIIRFHQFYKVLMDGAFYPRWAPDLNNGYGVPLFNFVYPLPNYVASFLHALGASFIDAFKYQMFLASIVGSIFFYQWTKKHWGIIGGVVSSIFYTYSPYHFLDVYVRGSVGEVWALALFPGFLWIYDRFLEKRSRFFFAVASIFFALIIFSHNILAFMFFPFAISYMIFRSRQTDLTKIFVSTFMIILLGVGISSIFWIPALFEKQFVTGLQIYDISSEFPQLYELLFPSWGTGFLPTDPGNKISFQIGIANMIAVLIAIGTVPHFKRRDKDLPIIIFFLLWFLLILFFMVNISYPVWKFIPLVSYIQFPWRLLSIEILIASFLAGSIFLLKNGKLLAAFIIAAPFFLGLPYTKPAYYHERDDQYYLSRSNFIDGTNSPGNLFNTIWFNKSLKKKKEKIEGEGLIIHDKSIKSSQYTFMISLKQDAQLTINSAFFPGWKVLVDNKEVIINKTKDGLIMFYASKGEHVIKVLLVDTKTRTIANSLFATSVLSILGLLVYRRFDKIRL